MTLILCYNTLVLLLPSPTNQSTCSHREEIWPSQPYVILMPNWGVSPEEAARILHIIPKMTPLIVEPAISIAPWKQWGEKGFAISKLYQLKSMCCWRHLWWEKAFTLRMKDRLATGMGHQQCWNHELSATRGTDLGCRLGPLSWTASPRTSPSEKPFSICRAAQ